MKPASMSSDAIQLQEDLVNKSQDLAGAGDNVTGNIDPTQTSGKAIIAVQQASQQPLNEQLNTMKFFIEDLANIWYDMLKTYSVNGITLLQEEKNEQTGETIEVPVSISQEELDGLKVHIRIDITPRSAYDKFAQEQSLENLFIQNKITFEEYVDVLDDDSTMPKLKLSKIVVKRKEQQQQMQQMQLQANAIQSQMQEAMIMQEQGQGQIQNIANQAQGVNDNFMNTVGGNSNEM